ncbi:MAG: polysaccharide lyase 6 family protein, partial [Pseudomonadota bacterium]|nr:polysaccharide lyase 6 family protein [Pseudomonadota bacterium]
VVVSALSSNAGAKQYIVSSQDEYSAIAPSLEAGDDVILKDGVYRDFEILLEGQGSADSPITLSAQTKGKVILSGRSNLRLAGQYLEVSGLVFKNGYTPTSSVIAFRKDAETPANYSRVSETVIDEYSNPDRQESDYWVALYGKHNRFDHNHLTGKRNKGVTVAVRLNGEAHQENHHSIDHNYFGYRPVFGSNGGETLRIGTSHYSLSNSYTQVINNIFEQTNGEVEIISVKSGENLLKGNVFLSAKGTLTLRHGNNNRVENNVFLGNGVDHTGGIRVINEGQVITNNYLEGLTGYRFGSGFTVMNGVPDSPINRYHQVNNAQITNNSFINVSHIQLGAGSDEERSAAPINSLFANNLIYNASLNQPFTLFDDVSGITFANNVTNTKMIKELSEGFTTAVLPLVKSENGLNVAKLNEPEVKGAETKNVGVASDMNVVSKSDVGVSWYPKIVPEVNFTAGKTINVGANAVEFMTALENASDGDVIAIAPGTIVVPSVLIIDKTVTVTAQVPKATTLSFERSALFEIHDNGNLKLDGLVLSGKNSPDAFGNSVVRTKKWGMLHNYVFNVENCDIERLDINHSFNFFTSGKGAFADYITLSKNNFNAVTGLVISLDKEIEDYCIYNAEYVRITNNTFKNVSGSVVNLYRGGTDESTFGPHLSMLNNVLTNVGSGKRNKQSASVYVHGVQVSTLHNNEFNESEPIVVNHTVGEPKTTITSNVFVNTSAPKIEEQFAHGTHTALLQDNVSTK